VPSLHLAVAPAGAVGAAIGRGTQLPLVFVYEPAPHPAEGGATTSGCVVDVAARAIDSKYAICSCEYVASVVGATVVATVAEEFVVGSTGGVVAAGVAVAARTVTCTVVTGAGSLEGVTVDVVAGADVPTVVDETERGASVVPTTTVRPWGCTIAPNTARPTRMQTVASTP
jgi:hypothetical protein